MSLHFSPVATKNNLLTILMTKIKMRIVQLLCVFYINHHTSSEVRLFIKKNIYFHKYVILSTALYKKVKTHHGKQLDVQSVWVMKHNTHATCVRTCLTMKMETCIQCVCANETNTKNANGMHFHGKLSTLCAVVIYLLTNGKQSLSLLCQWVTRTVWVNNRM